jgi:hypothetical protein
MKLNKFFWTNLALLAALATFSITRPVWANEIKGPLCDMSEVLADNAISYRLSGKSYSEALQSQRLFMKRGGKGGLDYDLERFIERIGLDLVDNAYETELPNFQNVDQMIYFQRQWAKAQTKWCR